MDWSHIHFAIIESAELSGDKLLIQYFKNLRHITEASIIAKGKHCLWLDFISDFGAKIINTHYGKIESFKDWDKGRNREQIENGTFNDDAYFYDHPTLESIANEYRILHALAEHNMAPPVKGLFYIKNFISDYPYGVKNCDCMGRFGYYVQDANNLPRGEYTFDSFKKLFLDTGIIEASDGALGDLQKSDNVVNGYLIDVRRTIWDMMQYKKNYYITQNLSIFLDYQEDAKAIHKNIKSLTQFPHKERKQNYQSYWLKEKYIKGSRDTLKRFKFMGIPEDLSGKTVLDLGCQLGSMANECWRRGARKITGLEYEKDYVDCARDLARYNGFHVNYLHMDLKYSKKVIEYINAYYKEPIDIVFALSLYKHIKNTLWEILRDTKWRICYLESHNAPDEFECSHVKEMARAINNMGINYKYLGQDTTRSPRCVWRLERKL